MKRQSISLYKKGFLLCLAVFISLGACACAHRMENEGWDYNAKRGPTPLVIGGQEPSNGASQDFSPNTYVPYVGGKIKFTYSAAMAAESIHAAESYIQAFTAAYPEVTVTTDSVAANIDAQISAGTIGDVFLFPDEDIYKYAKTYQCLMDLTPYFSVYKVDTDDIYPGLTEAAVLNGSFCYVPAFYAQTALLCNLTVLKELGLADKISSRLTWNEFTDMVRQTAFSPEGEATYRRTKIDLTDDVNFTAFIEAYTGHADWCGGAYQQIRFFDENALTLSALREAVELAQEGFMCITGGENTLTVTPSDHYQASAQYVFQSVYYSEVATLGALYDSMGIEWDLMSMPQFPSGLTACTSYGMGVYNRTANPDTAAMFALFLTTEKGQAAYNGTPGTGVPTKASMADAAFWRYPAHPTWADKNWSAFLPHSFDSTVAGQTECRMPVQVSNLIENNIEKLLLRVTVGAYPLEDEIRTLESECNTLWKALN